MDRLKSIIIILLLHFGAIWSQDTHWMFRSVTDLTVIHFHSKKFIEANLTIEDVFGYPYIYSAVSGTIETKEPLTDAYTVRI